MPDSSGKKTPPAFLFALGRCSLPEQVEADGVRWRFVKLYKHDFFAATGLYEREGPTAVPQSPSPATGHWTPDTGHSLAVLKLQRTHHLFGFPMQWLGRWVAGHEIRIYQVLQGVPGVPKFLGRVGPTGFLHEFVPGEDLRPGMPFTPEFFSQLHDLLQAIHDRHIAYVDTNKRENILFGADGRPWLIDFQISWFSQKGDRAGFISRRMLRRFQRADWYHFYKHKTRLLPSACSPEDFARADHRGKLHNFHRLIARPITDLRRKFLSRYKLEKTK